MDIHDGAGRFGVSLVFAEIPPHVLTTYIIPTLSMEDFFLFISLLNWIAGRYLDHMLCISQIDRWCMTTRVAVVTD